MSVSGALDKIEKQAQKLKTRETRKRKEGRPQEEREPEETVQQPMIVPLSLTKFKPMTIQEAVFEIENGPNPFVIFRDHDKGEMLTVLFKRDDRTLGLVSLG